MMKNTTPPMNPQTEPSRSATLGHFTRGMLLAAMIALLPKVAEAAPAGVSIGINFRGTSANYVVGGAAGVSNAVIWNDKVGHSGTGTSLLLDNGGSSAASTATLTWVSNGANPQTNTTTNSPSDRLMNSFLDSGTGSGTSGHPTLTVSDLDPVFLSEGYDVYVYVNGQGTSFTRGGTYIATDNNGASNSWNCGFTCPTYTDAGGFVQDVTQGNTTAPTETPGANYILFTNLTGSSFTIITSAGAVTGLGSQKTPIAGIEVIARAAGVLPVGPQVLTQPVPQALFEGYDAKFTVAAAGSEPIYYQWAKDGAPLSDGGNISGATTTNLIVAGVSAGDVAGYSVVVSNSVDWVVSDTVSLTVLTTNEDYETAVVAGDPVAYYQFNDTGDSLSGSPVFDSLGGYNGTYGTIVLNGLYGTSGPLPSGGYPGFADPNGAAEFAHGSTYTESRVNVAPWNLNTNAVTFTAWIKPTGPQNEFNALVFCRGGGTTSGFNYSGSTNAEGNFTLGYTWNNDGATWGWNSGITATPGEWSLAALVVTPTNASVYVATSNGVLASTHVYNHVIQSFSGTTVIGNDSFNYGLRGFNGTIDEVAVFNRALDESEIAALFTAASGISDFPPAIGVQPASLSLYEHQTAQFAAIASGTAPLSYQWQSGTGGVYADVTDGGRISGAMTPSLVISNLALADAMDFICVVTNAFGVTTSSVAVLTVNAVSPATEITTSVIQPSGSNWDTDGTWSLAGSATDLAAQYYGSTFTILAPGGLRTPELGNPNSPTTATFPGDELRVEGNGTFDTSLNAAGAVRLKGGNPSTVHFKKLVMAGGQISSILNNGWPAILTGEVNVISNAVVWAADDTSPRSITVQSLLTGNGNITYRGYINLTTFQTNSSASLNIANAANTFSGSWNVVFGSLVGSAVNALGTNSITVGAQGALQTTYNLTNNNANLILNGRLYLTGDHTFKTAFVNGVPVAPGTYTAAQLAAAYPANFPTNWVGLNGAGSLTNAAGSLTVLATAGPVILTQPASMTRYEQQTASFSVAAAGDEPLSYQWKKFTNSAYANVVNGGRISGATGTNLVITDLALADAGDYIVVVTNSLGSVTSSVAALTVNPVGPAEHITLTTVQNNPQDWNTTNHWSDTLPASLSSASKPGSTYEVVAGTQLRTPASGAFNTFPGDELTISGDGIWTSTIAGATVGQLALKGSEPLATIAFKKLVLDGGLVANFINNDSYGVITGGEVHVASSGVFWSGSNNGGAHQNPGFRIESQLTGSGLIEYRGYGGGVFQPTWVGGLNIAGTNNTYTGEWNVVIGTLLGTTPGALGTNSITVGTNGAFQASYDINNPDASLILDGRMNLTRDHTFGSVTVTGTNLASGTYTHAELAAAFPANFPASWTGQTGATGETTASGSITIPGGTASYPTNLVSSYSGGMLSLSWPSTHEGWILQQQSNALSVGLNTNWTDIPGTASVTATNISVNATNQTVFFRLRHP